MSKAKTPFIEVVFKALTLKPQSGAAAIAAKLGYDKSPARVRKTLVQLVKDKRAVHTGAFKTSAYTRAK
jgi:hypothetical protein